MLGNKEMFCLQDFRSPFQMSSGAGDGRSSLPARGMTAIGMAEAGQVWMTLFSLGQIVMAWSSRRQKGPADRLGVEAGGGKAGLPAIRKMNNRPSVSTAVMKAQTIGMLPNPLAVTAVAWSLSSQLVRPRRRLAGVF